MIRGFVHNNLINFYFIPLIFIILTILLVSCIEDIFAEEIIATIPVGDSPVGLTFNPFNNNMYIANSESDTVSVIDSDLLKVIATIPVEGLSLVSVDSPMEFNPFNNNIYVANQDSNTVSVINSTTNTVIATIPVGIAPFEPEFNPFDKTMYILNRGDGTVSVINSTSNTVIDTITVESNPQNIFYNPLNNMMYVANTGSGTVSIIDVVSRMVTSIEVGPQPIDIELNPSNNHLYVANSATSTVSVIDSSSNTVINTLNVARFPTDLEFDPFNNSTYIAFNSPSSVFVVDKTDTIDIVGIGRNTFSLEYNSFNTNMYVSTSSDTANNITKSISSETNTVIDTIEVGNNPEHLGFNPANTYIYTANRESDSVSVIGPELETRIIDVKDGEGNSILNDKTTTSSTIQIDVETRNLFDVDGVICYLNDELYDPCDQFDDHVDENPESDLKECILQQSAAHLDEEIEICNFTINLVDLIPGEYNFTIAAFEEVPTAEFFLESLDKEMTTNLNKIIQHKTQNNNNNNIDNNLHNNSIISSDFKSGNYQQTSATTSAIPFSTSSIEFSMLPLLSNNLNFTNSIKNIENSAENHNHDSLSSNSKKTNFEFKDTLPSFVGNSIISNNITKDNFVNGIVNDPKITVQHDPEIDNINSNKLEIQHDPNSPFIFTDETPESFSWTGQQQEGIQVNTILNSAIDGKNNPVDYLGATDSNFINFTFSGIVTIGPPIIFENCDDCFLPTNQGGPIPPGQLTALNSYLANNEVVVGNAEPQIVGNVTGLCELIEEEGGITVEQLITILTDASPGQSNPQVIEDIIECLGGLILEDADIEKGFDCYLDGGGVPFLPCTGNVINFTGSQTYNNLTLGPHTFLVRAFVVVDGQKIVDPTPSYFTWIVVPDTIIDSAQGENNVPIFNGSQTTSTSIEFNFSALHNGTVTDEVDGFECKLDNGNFTDCSSPTLYQNLLLGNHEFNVRSFIFEDETRVYDPTPARWIWEIVPEDIIVNTTIDDAVDGNGVNVQPNGVSGSSSITFFYSGSISPYFANIESQGFECKLDNGNFTFCPINTNVFSDVTSYTDLAPGEHNFTVRAFVTVIEGDEPVTIVDQDPPTFTWTVIQVNTTINSAIDGKNNPVDYLGATDSNFINFTFSGSVSPEDIEIESLGFDCYLDGGGVPFLPCTGNVINFTGSQTYNNLTLGPHTFLVRAFVVVDGQKIVDPTPSYFTWIVVPDTIIDSAQGENNVPIFNGSQTTSTSIEFNFSALHNGTVTDEVDGFECKLDNGNFTDCSSPTLYQNLLLGNHEFNVRSFIFEDETRVYDPTPARWIWEIVPEDEIDTIIESAEDGEGEELEDGDSTTSDSITFTFFAELNDEQTTEADFICILDDGDPVECNSGTITYEDLDLGEHTFQVTAFIPEGISDPSPATFSWDIDEEP
ncbi:MAG: YncE family protein, partial [Nitrososphaeraceae archaeon]